MYERYSRRVGWSFDLLDSKGDSAKGLRLAVCEISGEGAERLHQEAGAHSIQHITRSRNADRIHTSNASIVVFNRAELDGRGSRLLKSGEIRFDTFRGHGAGGQHRNVTDSAVRATHVPSGTMATVTSGRSQAQNRELVLVVLLARLAESDQAEQDAGVQRKRRSQAKAGRAQTTRVYDLVRDVVRCGRTGKKIRRVKRVLDGDLSELLE